MDKQTDRLFIIFETIVKKGPLTLAELVSATGIPRSAIHRTAQLLQMHGWIRPRLSDHAYEATSRFDYMMGSGHFAHHSAETHQNLLKRMSKAGFNAYLAAFIKRGSLVLIEATTKEAEIGTALPLVNNAVALVALRQLEPVSRIRHLETYLSTAGQSEAEAIRAGVIARQLAAEKPTVAVVSGTALILPLMDKTEPSLTLSISPKSTSGKAVFKKLASGTLTTSAILAAFQAD